MQQVLKVASLLGYRFIEDVLVGLTAQLFTENDSNNFATDSVKIQLENAVNQRFVERVAEGYQFSHDKIQAAFQSLTEKKEQEEIHLVIGRGFLASPNENSKYQSAVHLNRAWNILKYEDKITNGSSVNCHIELAMINLEASKYCEERSAFSDSVSFLRKGLGLLDGREKWLNTFDLAYEMTESLARMEFIVGNIDACKIAKQEAILRAKSNEQKINMLSLEIESRMVNHELDSESSKRVLGQLGIQIPIVVTPLHFYRKLRKLRKMFKKMSDEDILSIPCTENPRIVTGMKLMMVINGNSLVRKKVILAAYVNCVAAELTLEEGLSPFGSLVICQLGILESILGNEEQAIRLAELSLKLLQMIPCKGCGCVVIINGYLFSLYKKRRFHDCLLTIPTALDDVMKVGDICSASYCLSMYCFSIVTTGNSLKTVEKLLRKMHDQISDFGGEFTLFCIQPTMQFIINLQQKTKSWKHLTTLTGEIMNEEEFIRTCPSEMHAFSLYLTYLKMILSLVFGFYKEGYTYGKELYDSRHPIFLNSYISIPFRFCFAMISYNRYHATGNRGYLRNARKCVKMFAQQHSNGNPNILAYQSILNVEEKFIKTKDIFEVCSAYKSALEIQIKEGYNHMEAMAFEQISRFAGMLGYHFAAKTYLERAKYAYKEKWGAIAKYNMLEYHQGHDDLGTLHKCYK